MYFVYSYKTEDDFETNIYSHVWENIFIDVKYIKDEIKAFVARLHNDGRPNDKHYIRNMIREVFRVANFQILCNRRRIKLCIQHF